MKKRSTRMIAWILCLCLVMSNTTMTAFAAEDGKGSAVTVTPAAGEDGEAQPTAVQPTAVQPTASDSQSAETTGMEDTTTTPVTTPEPAQNPTLQPPGTTEESELPSQTPKATAESVLPSQLPEATGEPEQTVAPDGEGAVSPSVPPEATASVSPSAIPTMTPEKTPGLKEGQLNNTYNSSEEVIDSGSCGDQVTWTLYADGVLELAGEGVMDNFDFQAPWYAHKDQITKAVIGEGITSIGTYAFYLHTALLTVSVSSTVKSIEYNAFYGASGLNTIEGQPEGLLRLPDTVEKINNGGFGYTAFTDVYLGGNLQLVGTGAFSRCKLDSITIAKDIGTFEVQIRDGNNGGSTSAYNTLYIGKDVTADWWQNKYVCHDMDTNQFFFNDDMQNRVLELCVYNDIIVDEANSEMLSQDGVLYVKNDTGYTLAAVPHARPFGSFPSDLDITVIGEDAFPNNGVSGILTLPETVTRIERRGLAYCPSLTEIVLPAALTEIGPDAFYGDDLERLTFKARDFTITESENTMPEALGNPGAICGYTDSYANEIAWANGLDFYDIETNELVPYLPGYILEQAEVVETGYLNARVKLALTIPESFTGDIFYNIDMSMVGDQQIEDAEPWEVDRELSTDGKAIFTWKLPLPQEGEIAYSPEVIVEGHVLRGSQIILSAQDNCELESELVCYNGDINMNMSLSQTYTADESYSYRLFYRLKGVEEYSSKVQSFAYDEQAIMPMQISDVNTDDLVHTARRFSARFPLKECILSVA